MDSRIIKKEKKMKNRYKISTIINKIIVWVIVMTLSITGINAQTDLPDAPVDQPAAPIDGSMWALALLGLLYAYVRLKTIAEQASRI